MSFYCYTGFKDINIHTPEEMTKMNTRQLLAELRSTYTWGYQHCWGNEDWDQLNCYRAQLKAELATREHIPNKWESKGLRKLRKKRGYK